MTQRVHAVLAGLAVPSWVGTFHSLAARQLRIEPEVAGLRGGFEILDADDSEGIIYRTAAAVHVGGHEDAGDAGRDQQSLENPLPTGRQVQGQPDLAGRGTAQHRGDDRPRERGEDDRR